MPYPNKERFTDNPFGETYDRFGRLVYRRGDIRLNRVDRMKAQRREALVRKYYETGDEKYLRRAFPLAL